MRALFIAAALALTPPAIAQVVQGAPEQPAQPAPAATASIEQRQAWCEKYAAWLVTRLPAESDTPTDVRPTHRVETEMNACTIDPQDYARQTAVELEHAAEVEAG